MADYDNEDWMNSIRIEELTREISLDAYADEQVAELAAANNDPEEIAEARSRMEGFVQSIRHHAAAGDACWEWVSGTEPLMQSGGLAVVRNGKIVWGTMTWIS